MLELKLLSFLLLLQLLVHTVLVKVLELSLEIFKWLKCLAWSQYFVKVVVVPPFYLSELCDLGCFLQLLLLQPFIKFFDPIYTEVGVLSCALTFLLAVHVLAWLSLTVVASFPSWFLQPVWFWVFSQHPSCVPKLGSFVGWGPSSFNLCCLHRIRWCCRQNFWARLVWLTVVYRGPWSILYWRR